MNGEREIHADASGERFVPETMAGGLIEAEHRARYLLAGAYVRGRSVLDAGCGVGWGAALLAGMGAASVRGIDIAAAAVAAARRRAPDLLFDQGDLLDLPYADGQFEVVVCFEALEHTSDTSRALDELRRVTAPGGVVIVSSPNPAVYPPGNPFHLHELAPDELLSEMRARFANVALYRQHLMLASTIVPDGVSQLRLDGVVPESLSLLGAGYDPYSLVMASDGDLHPMPGVQSLATSHQLVELAAAAAALDEERGAIRADHRRIVAERAELLAAIAAERAAWAEGDRRVAAERERVLGSLEQLRLEADAARARAAAAEQERDDAQHRELASQARASADLRAMTAEVEALRSQLASTEAALDEARARLHRT
jgi:2-polyprenyl-3-methyl-5-hydroxy-6-metoxy-1,4-benzoquinol methylase